MEEHKGVDGADLQNPASLLGLQLFDFAQHEGLALMRGQALPAAADQLTQFLRQEQPFQLGRRASPCSVSGETRLEYIYIVNRIRAIGNGPVPAALQRLAGQDAE